jgi:anti-sigma factor RsiW
MRLRLWPRRRAAHCSEVITALLEFLDGEVVDAETGARVEQHLEACRRCGLEASVYREIKQSLRQRRGDADAAALDRLRVFVARVGAGDAPRSQ